MTPDGATKPLDARIVRSRSRLEEAMRTLLAARRLEDITVADIVEAAGVGYATFFRHYADKQALWQTIADGMISDMNALMGPRFASGDHRGAAQELCAYVVANWEACRVMLVGGAADHVREAMLRNSLAIAEAQPPGVGTSLPRTLGSYFGVNAMFAILAWWLDGREAVPAATIAAAIDRLVYAPLMDPEA